MNVLGALSSMLKIPNDWEIHLLIKDRFQGHTRKHMNGDVQKDLFGSEPWNFKLREKTLPRLYFFPSMWNVSP